MADLKIGDEVYIHGFVDEVRRDTVIIKNEGGYFGTVTEEIIPSAQPEPKCANGCIYGWGSTECEHCALKSTQPEPQWIPCSKTEDLPKHEVLCCDKYGEELIGWLSYSDDQWLCESDCEMMYDPIAWREKPEPWRGEEHVPDE